MGEEVTLALIKPDAVRNHTAGEILHIIEHLPGLTIGDCSMMHWDVELARKFYAEHESKPYFQDLTEFMSSGPLYAITLIGSDVVKTWRELIGPTDPRKGSPAGLRCLYGSHRGPVMHNAVHGSDTAESARKEIRLISVAYAALVVQNPYKFWGGVAEACIERIATQSAAVV